MASFNDDITEIIKRSLKSTPGYLTAMRAAVLAATLLLYVMICYGVSEHRSALRTVCHDAAPSIIAAQHLKAALADLDANAANELLERSGQNKTARQDYDRRRKEIADNLVQASENITYGDAERVPLQNMELVLAQYEELVTRARVMNESGNVAGKMDAFIKATTLLHSTLLVDADALDKANLDVLNETWKHQQVSHYIAMVLNLIGVALLGYSLFRLQTFLSLRTKRTFNQGLLAASALAAIACIWTAFTFLHAQEQLRVAKEDAFDSIHFLWKTRAVANDANGSESRWLLAQEAGDTASASRFADEYTKLSSQIVDAGPNINQARDLANRSQPGKEVGGFHGLLAQELKNVTFPGERDAALHAVDAWVQYCQIDARIRQLVSDGKKSDAIELCCGNGAGQSNFVFGQFDDHLEETLKINQKAFDDAYKSGTDRLSAFDFEVAVFLIGVAAATILGLRPRLREYTF